MTATSQEALIDHSVIEELQQAMGAAAFSDIVATFCDQIPKIVGAFGTAAAKGDIPGATHLAHELIGLAGTMGAPRLSNLARQAMVFCRNQQPEALAAIAATIEQVSDDTLKAFRTYA